MDIDRIDLLDNQDELEDVIEELKNRRRQLVDFSKLDTDEREFQDLMCRILDRNPNFEVEFAGAKGTDGGMDALIHYVGGMNPMEVLLQCKRNTSSSLSPQDVREERNKIDGNHDASMLFLACMSVSRNVRDQQKNDKFKNHNVHEVEIWQKEKILNELCEYPYLIREFFY